MELVDYQWELDGVAFGIDCPVDHDVTVAPGGYTIRSNDVPTSQGDGLAMGIDLMTPGAWQFQLFTNCENEADALAANGSLATVWRGDDVRQVSNGVLPLRYALAGRTRRVYGRPRKYSAPLGPEFHSGMIKITADFQQISELHFDDAEDSQDIFIGEPVTGGFSEPLVAPITTTQQNATRPGSFSVGGELTTPMVVEFHGPLNDPVLDIDGLFQVPINGTIPIGRTLIVDARPWVLAASWDSGGGAGSFLDKRLRMQKLKLTTGAHTATLGGRDDTGTGFARVKWRKAHPTI